MTIKDELCSRMMKEFVALTPKKYSYLTDDRLERQEKVCCQIINQI